MMTSTPPCTVSPTNIAPAPILSAKTTNENKMAAAVLDAPMAVSNIGPTRNWVIPPRPKPGRKPATDTPPTKRKAQNRAAQRAFRERRAARVGELEEQLKETEEERQKRESATHDQITLQSAKISKLEETVQRLSEEAHTWRDRYFALQQKSEDECREKDAALMELAYLRNGSRATGTNAVPLPPRRQQNLQSSQRAIGKDDEFSDVLADEPLGCGGCTTTSNCACLETAMSMATSGCGKCTIGGPCECLDETLKAAEMEGTTGNELKRPLFTASASSDFKRPRFYLEQPQHQEIDFTTQFEQDRPHLATNNSSQDQLVPSLSRIPTEPCGFCAEGTYCACTEESGPSNTIAEAVLGNRLAPLLNEVTPPPSDTDGSSPDVHSFKLPPLHPNHQIHHSMQSGSDRTPNIPRLLDIPTKQSYLTQDSTSEGPGSCKQCQEDPKSGLFCRSLAAIRASDGSMSETPGECCGGRNTAGGGCCRKQDNSSALSLSCADTYKTLAVHKNFDQATDNLTDWLPKLQTSLPGQTGRAPLDIEAASVMNVLKYFDVRFGRS